MLWNKWKKIILQILVFEICSILYSTYIVNWGLREADSETLTSDTHLAREIQSESIWGLGTYPPNIENFLQIILSP